MSKQKKTEAAILGVLDGLSFDVSFDDSNFPDNIDNNDTAIETSKLEKLVQHDQEEKNFPENIARPSTPPKEALPAHKGKLLYIPVDQCKPWDFANRPQLEMGDIDELARSIKEDGQTVPVLARPCKKTNSDVKYEIIYGHRRWRACKLCNLDLFAIVIDIPDKIAAKEQKKENEKRKDLSEFAEAWNYKKMLDEKVFSSQMELAATLGIPRQSLHNILSYTKIPQKVLDAMKTPHLLPQRTAIRIAQISKDLNEKQIHRLCDLAPQIISKKIPFKDISPTLLEEQTSKVNTQEQTKYPREVVVNKNNIKLFTAGLNHNKVPSITFHKFVTDNNLYNDIVSLVKDYLQEKSKN